MAEPDDMHPDAPVTRAELREELARHPTRVELEQALAKLATKADLAKLEERATRFEERVTRFEERFAQFVERLFAELASHSLANQEAMTGQVGVVDEKYKDLPERVLRLEHAVFKPRRRARRS